MSITYPSSLDNFPNPQSTDLLDNSSPTLDHWTQHANINDAVEALEAKVGVDGSAVTTSFDYKLGEVTSTDKAVGKTATQTLTNKTLTSPVINVGSDATGDLYYRNAGVFTRLPVGASGELLSSSGTVPQWIANPSTADASTTVKGVVELATLAETLAKTSTGGTGAKLVVTPDNMNSTLVYDYAADSVGTDAYAITLTPAPTAYVTGQRFTFKAGTANTGAATLNVNSLGAKTIKLGTSNLYTGQILANQIVEVVYDGTNMQLVSLSPLSTNATITEAVSSSNTRTSNTAIVQYGPSTPTSYTLMKEILYNDVPGTVNVVFSSTFDSGGGVSTQYSRVYINGVAVGTERTTQSTFTESFTVATGDLIQIYGKVAYTSGNAVYSVRNMYLNYDKQLKQTFITNTNNS